MASTSLFTINWNWLFVSFIRSFPHYAYNIPLDLLMHHSVIRDALLHSICQGRKSPYIFSNTDMTTELSCQISSQTRQYTCWYILFYSSCKMLVLYRCKYNHFLKIIKLLIIKLLIKSFFSHREYYLCHADYADPAVFSSPNDEYYMSRWNSGNGRNGLRPAMRHDYL